MTKKDLLCQFRDRDCIYFQLGPSTHHPDGEVIHLVFHTRPNVKVDKVALSEVIKDLTMVRYITAGGAARWTGWMLRNDKEGLNYSIMESVTLNVRYEHTT